jgi:CRISP-associated protein Cas1
MDKSDNPKVRVMALHALAYCERLFYLEEVEEIRVADDRVFAGRTLHEDIKRGEEEAGYWESLDVSSERLGLTGKLDALRRRDGTWIPYEHKRGRSRTVDKRPEAWPSDRLQVCAYGMLLEEEKGETVRECRVRYHADNATVRIPLDEAARSDVTSAVSRAVVLRSSTARPAVTENDRRCIHCSLAPVCLPEEERLAADSGFEPIRLFPPARELKVIHVSIPGARVSRSGDTLKVVLPDESDRVFPSREVGSIVLHGYCQLTTQALHLCAWRGIPIHWISAGGKYMAGLAAAGGSSVQRRIRQFEALTNAPFRLGLARKTAGAKIEAQLRYVLRVTRGDAPRSSEIEDAVNTMRSSLRGLAKCDDVDQVRGHEGMAGKAYFSTFKHLLRADLPEPLSFTGRSRRPPKDRFNAILSFGYSLLYQSVLQAVLAVGLDPAFGFFHTPRSSAQPLVMDLVELFRVSVWDAPLLGSLNRLHWNPDDDFEATGGGVWLSSTGRKKAIALYEKRLEDKWRHPVIGYSLSYARLMELETRLLEKEWTGSPGLFARMRLR